MAGQPDVTASVSGAAPSTPVRVTTRQKILWTVVGAALAFLVAAGLVLSGLVALGRPSTARPLRVSIVHAEGHDVGAPAVSPDGTRVAYAARRGVDGNA